ncbi:helix-hairpin-helix domain-containing protein [Neptunomonas sp.]|uniref:ComEA family DNA-binding protein n=1 Tax=Neptunomonas sp. TaxID=1971898 RepID=UPI003568E972
MNVTANSTNQLTPSASIPSDLNLSGGCGYEILHDQVVINISHINNFRDTNSISGTLALELWALEQPYNGNGFRGHALSATSIGELSDLHFIQNQRYNLPFKAPSSGTWYFTLMLREWDGYQYVTRDYVNFNLPYIVNEKPQVSRSETDNVITVNFSGNKTASDINSLDINQQNKKDTPTQPISEPQQAVKKAASDKVVTHKAATNKVVTQKAAGKKAPIKKSDSNTVSDAKVSINNATASQLEVIKGMSKQLAQNIVADRPFKTLDETLQVKGMGPKLLQKMRSFLSL